ncbi:MAG: aspartate--tRNA ligase [Oscillospiraceae bacterium]|jgi:aspartyl-tRNA synthetase|nr:aspartate--tRNA ligase [Oscillospiraceae bacterium]
MLRTEYCGAFSEKQIGESVTASGWVTTKRDMGGVIFLDLCDKEGTLQVVFNQSVIDGAGFHTAERLKNQSVITVAGKLRRRDAETLNPNIATGTIELMAEEITVLSAAKTLPFSIDDSAVREELRLKYRYLDLRKPSMQRNLRFRHSVQKAAADYLDGEGFISVDTPILTKSTPEGARDYLVPSRGRKGSFYALPQSPQIFKQLLMVGGIDRYYQIAKCFRDEDLRADRQPEFTQIDVEMSFVEQEDVIGHIEALVKHVMKSTLGIAFDAPFPRITWREAMDSYGTDKPDMRFELKITDVTETAGNSNFTVFRKAAESGGKVCALCIKGGADMSRSDIEALTDRAISYGAKGMAWIMLKEDGEIYSILTKFLSEKDMARIIADLRAENGDFILFCADTPEIVRKTLGGLRCDIADLRGLRRKDDFKFLFVTDFPLFEYSEEQGRFMSTHHPFTMPYKEDMEKLASDPGAVRSHAYDIVLNGTELGGGSIRIHDSAMQNKMFRALGLSPSAIRERFGFMVDAFKYGTPPHGGFALGLDRFVMLLLGAESLREVIAFPKTADAVCLMTDAPSGVDMSQLEALGIGVSGEERAEQRQITVKRDVDIKAIANLARLNIAEYEAEDFTRQMNEIVEFAGILNGINTDGVEITAHTAPVENVLREDIMLPSFPSDLILQGSPSVQQNMIFVPKVFE